MADLSYAEWKKRFNDASDADYQAYMECCKLDDKGESGTERFRELAAKQKNWEEVKEALMAKYPEFEKRRMREAQNQ